MSHVNYLRVEFRVISEKILETEIANAIDLGQLSQIIGGPHESIVRDRDQELRVSGKIYGENRWDKINQALDWAKENEGGFKKVHANADIFLDITIVCNIRRMKNPIPEKTKEKIREIVGAEISVRNEAKERQPAKMKR